MIGAAPRQGRARADAGGLAHAAPETLWCGWRGSQETTGIVPDRQPALAQADLWLLGTWLPVRVREPVRPARSNSGAHPSCLSSRPERLGQSQINRRAGQEASLASAIDELEDGHHPGRW
jgi:hypothetical protein